MKLPRGWTKTLLYHVAFVQTGLSKSENRQGPSVKRPYLRVANVQDGYLDLAKIKEIDVPIEQVERFSLQKDDVVLTEGGDFDKLGRGCIWSGQIPGCVHQNHIFAVRVSDKAKLIPQFLAYQMQSNYGRQYFQACAKQTTNLASINASQLKEFPLLMPHCSEQNRIVDLISTWDAAIEKTEKLIQTKKTEKTKLARALLFGKIRRKDHRQSWRAITLKNITTEIRDRNPAQLGIESVMGVNKHYGLIPMREDIIGSQVYRYKVVPPKAFAYNPMRINIGSIARSEFSSNVLVSPDYVVFKCLEDRCDPDFLNHYRRTQAWESFVKSAGNGSVRIRIYYDDLASLKMQLPPLEEQKDIARVLNTAEKEIELTQKVLEAIKKQKRGLMQKLLTGKWRVKV